MTNLKFGFLKEKIPLPIRLFLGKALLFFIIWKIIYGIFLYESQIIDSVLTKHIGNASVKVLNSLGDMNGFKNITEEYQDFYGEEIINNKVSAIYHNDKKVLHIANVCNGLELIILYIGFIVCMPSKFWRKLKYIIIGAILLDAINILRCVGLIYLREYYEVYFDFAHHYLFKATVYLSTFLLWVVFSRKIQLKNDTLQI